MKVNVKMNVKAADLYDVLMLSLQHDIKQATGEALRVNQIKEGFTYSKMLKNKMGKMATSQTVITKLEKNKWYAAQFTTSRGKNTVAYQIKEISEHEIEVVYAEEYLAANKNKELNFKLMNFFFKKGIRKRAHSLLQMMERHIICEKEKGVI